MAGIAARRRRAAQKRTVEFEDEEIKVGSRTWTRCAVPRDRIREEDVVRYDIDIRPVLLPHLNNRALTMKR